MPYVNPFDGSNRLIYRLQIDATNSSPAMANLRKSMFRIQDLDPKSDYGLYISSSHDAE